MQYNLDGSKFYIVIESIASPWVFYTSKYDVLIYNIHIFPAAKAHVFSAESAKQGIN